MDGVAERLPDAPVPGVLLQHALRMKLQPDYKRFLGVVVALDQSVFRESHWLETWREVADSLVMIAVHTQRLS